MKLPRDISGADLVKAPGRVGYRMTRQSGSHARLTIDTPSQHHVTVPLHDSLKLGTLSGVVSDVAAHLKKSKEELVLQLFDS